MRPWLLCLNLRMHPSWIRQNTAHNPREPDSSKPRDDKGAEVPPNDPRQSSCSISKFMVNDNLHSQARDKSEVYGHMHILQACERNHFMLQVFHKRKIKTQEKIPFFACWG